MFFDSITIVVCVVLVVLAVASSLADVLIKKVCTDDKEVGDNACKPVSIIIIADNNANELRKNLPLFLSQDYPAGFEVIVVVDKDEDGTGDVLKTFSKHANFYTTFVPDSSRYMSRRKLAITLGVKAAKHELILLTDATCKPVSDKWVSRMAAACTDGVNMVLGYSNYVCEAGSYKMFYRFRREYALLHEACSGNAYGMAGNNLLFRKSMFMSGNGFRGNLKYLRGEYHFLVNKYAKSGGVAVETHQDSFIEEEAPSRKSWYNRNVFYVETRRHLTGSFKHRAMFNIDMLMLHVCFLLSIASAVYAVCFADWLVLPFSCVALVAPFVVRTLVAKRAMAKFQVGVSLFKVVPYELVLIWHNLRYAMAYRFADKYDFISHKS